MSVLIMLENIWCYREIYNAGKNFTLLPAVTIGTNLTSKSTCGANNQISFVCVIKTWMEYWNNTLNGERSGSSPFRELPCGGQDAGSRDEHKTRRREVQDRL